MRSLIRCVRAAVAVSVFLAYPTASAAQRGQAESWDMPTLTIDAYATELLPVAWMGVTPSGGVALLQRLDSSVRLFGPDGTSEGSFGRSGEGPGEFRSLLRAGWVADSLWIADRALGRITLLEWGESSPGRTLRFPPVPSQVVGVAERDAYLGSPASPVAVYGDGSVLLSVFERRESALDRGVHASLIRVWSEGRAVHVLEEPAQDPRGTVTYRFGASGEGGMPVPFYPNPLLAISPDGSHIATVDQRGVAGNRFVIAFLNNEGDTITTHAMTAPAHPVVSAAIDSALARIRSHDLLQRSGQARAVVSEVRDRIPEFHPPVLALFLDNLDRAWIGLRAADGRRLWRCLRQDGTIEHAAYLPANITLHAADAHAVWGLRRDEFDVDHVVKFALPPHRERPAYPRVF